VLGPLLDCSALATRDDRVVGACLVVDRAGNPPDGGPWVLDVFRDPADPARGIGAAMLSQAARSARAASLPALSLAVTHENSAARAVYERLGFADLGESWTLALPG
jgi:ribosomal protein S18 acetylase RimI-like enzyme